MTETQDQILTLVRAGKRDGLACALAGVDPAYLRSWKIDPEFSQAYELARAEYEDALLERLRVESIGHARAPDLILRELRRWCPGQYDDTTDAPTLRIEALVDVEGIRARLASRYGAPPTDSE